MIDRLVVCMTLPQSNDATPLSKPLRIVQTENPEKEIWNRLSYFESTHNAKQYLLEKASKGIFSLENTDEASKILSVNMQAAREYYKAAEGVTALAKPPLLYYGMVNLAKALHVAVRGVAPEGKKHGLVAAKPWNYVIADLSVRVKQYGIFPEFYHCYSTEELHASSFSMKQLLSLVPETKVPFETVYKEKSRAIKALRVRYGISLVDSELQRYEKLEETVRQIPGIQEKYPNFQDFGDRLLLIGGYSESKELAIHSVTGEEFLVLPISTTNGKCIVLAELSTHFLIMFMLGLIARYHPKEWSEAIKGEESGDIYVIQNFLEATKRKFPNLILNELRQREFVFGSTGIEVEKKMSQQQLEDTYEYVSRRMGEELG